MAPGPDNIHLPETSRLSSTIPFQTLGNISLSSCTRSLIFCTARLTERIFQESFQSNIGESLPIVDTAFSSSRSGQLEQSGRDSASMSGLTRRCPNEPEFEGKAIMSELLALTQSSEWMACDFGQFSPFIFDHFTSQGNEHRNRLYEVKGRKGSARLCFGWVGTEKKLRKFLRQATCRLIPAWSTIT